MGLQATGKRSARLSFDSVTVVPADAEIRPLRDQLIVEPLATVHSSTLVVRENTKPLRGIVKAAGPGTHPKRYNHWDKTRRSKMWYSYTFRPTEVKAGDVVELGSLEQPGGRIDGYAFQTFYWGDTLHLWCREEDVAGVIDSLTPDQAREEASRAAA